MSGTSETVSKHAHKVIGTRTGTTSETRRTTRDGKCSQNTTLFQLLPRSCPQLSQEAPQFGVGPESTRALKQHKLVEFTVEMRQEGTDGLKDKGR